MNFATMLFQKVTPLADYTPRERSEKSAASAKMNAEVANKKRRVNAQETYRAAWQVGEVWLTTKEIQARIEKGGSVLPILRRWEDAGIVVSRPVVGANGRHRRNLGVEWSWTAGN